ncbi:MAG: hypothetical protein EXR29_01995 [Betaproteobacteria bacterium]|nr:hypothetical protein [Betaproteobacteria bacterium]
MIGPNDPQDQELTALYRAAAQELPPAGVDARILAAARARVRAEIGREVVGESLEDSVGAGGKRPPRDTGRAEIIGAG